jgi:hypothetical protein
MPSGDNMEVQEESSQVQDGLGDDVMESLGVREEAHDAGDSPEHEAHEQSEGSRSNESLAVQKRLKSQKRAHEREVRGLHQRIGELEARMMSQPTQESHDQTMNPYGAQPGNVDEQIHKAVSFALQHREMEERKAKEAQYQAHVYRKHQDFERHLENMADKYDDFHDVVMAPDASFTPTMKEYAARTMTKSGPGSAGEVLYKLGKNPQELRRIANLHPDDQAEELHKLSIALSRGGEGKSSESPRPLGNIKSNPVSNSNATVTDKTPVSSIRQRMKSGNWR